MAILPEALTVQSFSLRLHLDSVGLGIPENDKVTDKISLFPTAPPLLDMESSEKEGNGRYQANSRKQEVDSGYRDTRRIFLVSSSLTSGAPLKSGENFYALQ